MDYQSRTNTVAQTLRPSPGETAWPAALYARHDPESFAAYPPVGERIDTSGIDYPLLHAAVFFETNRRRARHRTGRLEPFAHSPALEAAAQSHSRAMARRGFFSHTSPVRGAETLERRLAGVGIARGTMAENIAHTFALEYESGRTVFTSARRRDEFSYRPGGEPIRPHTYGGIARAVVGKWMLSSGHRANILNPALLLLGVGGWSQEDREGSGMAMILLSQNFASRASP